MGLQNEINLLKQNKNENDEEKNNILIEKNQIINNLQTEKEKFEKEILSLNNHNDEITEKYKLITNELSESQNESKEILDQSKKHIEKMKKKFEIHQIDLI